MAKKSTNSSDRSQSSRSQSSRSNPSPDFTQIRQEVEAEIEQELGADDRIDTKVELLPDLETAIGMEEVDLDTSEFNNIVSNDVDNSLNVDEADSDDQLDHLDDNSSNIDDDEIIDDRPQILTESYGTGLQGQPTDRTGRYSRRSEPERFVEADPILTGGDIDANYEQADAVGDEAVGGTVATPDQDVVDQLGAAVGLEMNDRSFLRTNDELERRDDRRWELDPESSEDYDDRYE